MDALDLNLMIKPEKKKENGKFVCAHILWKPNMKQKSERERERREKVQKKKTKQTVLLNLKSRSIFNQVMD